MNELANNHDEREQQSVADLSLPGSRTVDLDIKCKDLSVSLHTRADESLEIVELTALVKVLSEHLALARAQLEEAHQKIGFLQAQILIQQQLKTRACSVQVDDLSSNQSLPKLPAC